MDRASQTPRQVRRLPLNVVLLAIVAAAMLVPAAYALATQDYRSARAFLYAGLLGLIAALLIGLAMGHRPSARDARSHLLGLLLAYLALPVYMAIPLREVLGTTTFVNAWAEMVSAFTTTGASYFAPARLDPALHLWRALVAWLGGLLIWVSAVAILAPLNLGGSEVTSEAQLGQARPATPGMAAASPAQRLRRATADLAPIYAALTGGLWLVLILSGEVPFVAFCHALSVLSTSGISPVGGLEERPGGLVSEMVIFAFLAFAISRRTFSGFVRREGWSGLGRDRELRIAVFCVVVLPTLLFVRHWIGALEVDDIRNAQGAFAALWGAAFTTLSFLTTTGFVSGSWEAAQDWSGLQTPGLILVGLAIMGGGVATTAGGVKLLRVYALYKHGVREMEKLLHPHSIGGSGGRAGRRIRREGAIIAWIFFMLFIVSVAGVAAALALTGLPFEAAMMMAVSSLTTTGPLAEVASPAMAGYGGLDPGARAILSLAMIVGRLEMLVILALLNPGYWRR